MWLVSFQGRINPWVRKCLGLALANNRLERNHRFLEESLELVQANGYSREQAHRMVDYVFDRPTGDLHQEVGGVMVTLAALCLAVGEDMHLAGEEELRRIYTKMDVIRRRQASKPDDVAMKRGSDDDAVHN